MTNPSNDPAIIKTPQEIGKFFREKMGAIDPSNYEYIKLIKKCPSVTAEHKPRECKLLVIVEK